MWNGRVTPRDLGSEAITVHCSADEAAPAILAFWFDEVGRDRWFAKEPVLDAAIARRFSAVRGDVLASRAKGWRDAPAHLLAAVLLFDQFSRNLFRGDARAFEADPLALELARVALDRGWVDGAPTAWRQFLLMPLMHSEKLADQQRSLAEFARLGDPHALHFAQAHHDLIARFGRFPGRNVALGRTSTVEEQQALQDGAAF